MACKAVATQRTVTPKEHTVFKQLEAWCIAVHHMIRMNPLRNINISAKLTLITVATAAAALLCVVVAFVIQDLRLVKRVKAEQVEAQLSILSGNLAHALQQNDLPTVAYLLKNGVSVHGIIAATVFDHEGRILSQYPMIAGRLAPLPSAEGFDFSTKEYIRPIGWHGQHVGQLQVLVSYSDVEMRIYYLAIYSALAFLFAIAIAAIVAWLVQKIVSQPLLRLHRLSQNVIETGNYSLRADVSSQDELGQLGDAFNRMLSQIEQRDLMMEKQVSQRTLELQKLAEEFRYRALHDTLTGLPNRALLNEEFNRAVAHAKRVGKHFAVLLLDLDNFKVINDNYGHEAGDELLKLVANKIRAALRGEDIVCRLGGDEFIILLEDVESEAHIEAVGESLLQALAQDLWVTGHPFSIGVSIGASFYPQHGVDITELKRNADIAMYCAKESGKNRLMVYQNSYTKTNLNKLAIQQDLENAVARQELELNYQPQVNAAGTTLVGCEALVRWRHQSYGLMQPADFIPFAEESGAVRQIDYFVIGEACRQSQLWRTQLGLRIPVSVNVSNVHFHSHELVGEVREILRRMDFPASMLTLELSEEVVLTDTAVTVKVLNALRHLGVRIALDGFGAGYCSFAHLRELKVDSLKLDRSLYRCIVRDQGERRLTKSLLAFGREMGVSIIVDGVEQQDQLIALRNLGCEVMQGFVYSQPIPQMQFLEWVKNFQSASDVAIGEV